MTASLPIAIAAVALPCTCTVYGVVDSTGTRGPGSIVQVCDGVHRRELGPWLCAEHSRERWGAYLAARAERLALIRLSWRLGYPCRRSDLERERARTGEQLTMWEGR